MENFQEKESIGHSHWWFEKRVSRLDGCVLFEVSGTRREMIGVRGSHEFNFRAILFEVLRNIYSRMLLILSSLGTFCQVELERILNACVFISISLSEAILE